MQTHTLLRLPEVIHITRRSRPSIYADVKDGRFPAPIKIGPRAVAWSQADIDAWIAARIQDSRQGGGR